MKKCVRCLADKPKQEFKPSATHKDGLFPYCYPCDRSYQRAYYAKRVGGLVNPGKGDRRPAEERFRDWYVPEPMSGCWLWLGTETGSNGYGRIKANGKTRPAHRYSWELHYGPIPDGLLVCHRCDNPSCVNPKHLFLGTVQDNSDDCRRKGRTARGERHPLSKLNEEAVLRIRRTDTPAIQLAAELKVSASLIQKIRASKGWSWLTK